MPIIINLFGEGIRYWICDIPLNRFEKMKKLKNEECILWEQFFYNLEFLQRFGYNHWSGLATRGEFKIFQLNKLNRIELKNKSRIIEKIKPVDLDNKTTLFPIYQTIINESINIPKIENYVTFVFVQQETGLFSKYELKVDKLLFSDLYFYLIQQIEEKNLNGLAEIHHQGKVMKSIREDTVVRGCNILWI